MLTPMSIAAASAAARAIIRPAASVNGHSSGTRKALTELPAVGLCSLQCRKAFVDPMGAGHFLQFAQLGRVCVDGRGRGGKASLARHHPIECRSGAVDLALRRAARGISTGWAGG